MLKVGLKGLLARKLRTALTGFAVVIGVAFVAGTFVFTDTIDASFKDLFERTSKGVDVNVQSRLAVESDFATPPPMEPETLERIEAVPGVEEAVGSVSLDATLLDRDGEPILSQGPPTLIITALPERFDPLTYVDGRPPQTADEVVLDKGTADEYGFGVGQTVEITARAPKKSYEVVGVATLGESENLAGSRMVEMTLPEAQRMLDVDGFHDISVAAENGTSPEDLKAAIAAELGPRFSVLTGEEQAAKSAQDLSDALGFIRIALLVFAGVAVLVGGFLIFNTFAVTVAQRTREFALLRTLGASRAQVLRSVLAESVTIGIVASVLGILGGLLLAPGLSALLSAFGLDLGDTSMVLEPRTVLIGLAVGVIATVVSGFVPARRATRVQPVEAMRESEALGTGRLRKRRVAAALGVIVLGVAVMLAGLLGDLGTASAEASMLGAGSVLMIIGVALVAPVLVRPLSSAIGRPLERVQGLTGRLARENATRQPQRTAVTASALMIGVALVVLVAILAAGISATIDKGIDEQVRAASIVTHEDGFSPIPTAVPERLAQVDGVTAVSPVRSQVAQVEGESGTINLTGIDPDTAGDVLEFNWIEGSASTLTGLGDGDAAVSDTFADDNDLATGDELTFTTPRGDEVTYRVAGIYESTAGLVGGTIVTIASLENEFQSNDLSFALVAGDDPAAIKRGEEQALADFPTAEPRTIEEFKDDQRQQVAGLLGLIYALLSLSVIVALLGIVNTLALSVHERTRELGMLRAVGMSRRQVRRMIRGESVITAAIGALMGIVLGLAFAAIVSRPLASEGFVFEVPVATLVVVVVLAAIAGVLAAIPPARRASRVDVLRAVTTE